jgi:hypothetical protein
LVLCAIRPPFTKLRVDVVSQTHAVENASSRA